MKKFAAILLVFLVAWPLLLKVVIFTSWQANRDYIAQNLCENKDNPDSDCAGTCQLAKQIQNADESKTPFLPHKAIEKINLPVYDRTLVQAFAANNSCEIIERQYRNGDAGLISFLYIDAVFHPPEVQV